MNDALFCSTLSCMYDFLRLWWPDNKILKILQRYLKGFAGHRYKMITCHSSQQDWDFGSRNPSLHSWVGSGRGTSHRTPQGPESRIRKKLFSFFSSPVSIGPVQFCLYLPGQHWHLKPPKKQKDIIMNWFIEKTKTFPKKGLLMNDFHLKSFPSFPVLVAGTKAIQKARIGNASRSARHLIRKQVYT